MKDADHHLYLASRSPRRGELLTQIGVRFRTVGADVDETPRPAESPETYVQRLAVEKARAGRVCVSDDDPRPVLAADTAVILGERILGKPADEAELIRMLGGLSGQTHRVLTAVALLVAGDVRTALSESRVTFRPIEVEEMRCYWRGGEPRDKAGGYGIQGLGALFITDLQGSYSGVMGLPLYETGCLLQRAGIRLIDDSASGIREAVRTSVS